MTVAETIVVGTFALGIAVSAGAQTPPPEPPPLWDAQVGASFVGTSGNTDTSTVGVDFRAHRRWAAWQIESTFAAVRAADRGRQTAERYIGAFRGKRTLTTLISLSAGERAERDRFAGVDFRSILDAGLSWALVRCPRWTLDGITASAWNHEQPVAGPRRNRSIGLLEALSRVSFAASGETTQRVAFYPDFQDSNAYRSEAELAAQAALNSRLALKVGYLWRYSNEPVFGFSRADSTSTASVVLRWAAR